MAECLWDAGVSPMMSGARGTQYCLSRDWAGGIFSQTLAKASSGQGALTACRRGSTQVSPDSSSAQLCEEFAPVGSGRKCDVSSYGFLIEAFTLPAKYFTPPCVSFPLAHSPYFLYLHVDAHMESISRSERRCTTISPSSVLHSEICVKKSSNIGHTDQTHLAKLTHSHGPCGRKDWCPIAPQIVPSEVGDPGGCWINVWAK